MSQQAQKPKQNSFYQKLISSLKGIVSEILPFSSSQFIEPQNEIITTPIIDDTNEEELRAVREYQPDKTSRTEYINQKNKKLHSILSITQYITNAKYNSNQGTGYDSINRQLHNSAFTAINEYIPYSHPSLDQRKEIINCNDFSVNKQLKPLTLLNHKHKRDTNDSEDSNDNNNDNDNDNDNEMTKRIYKVSSISFGNTSFYCKSKYKNNNNKLNDSYNKYSSLVNNTAASIINKQKDEDNQLNESSIKEMTLFQCKTPFSFDYLDRKKSLIEYYDNKSKEQERRKEYIMNKDKERANFTDLLYGRDNSFELEGKLKPMVYQVKQEVALNIDQKPLYLQRPIIKQSSISFEYMKNNEITKEKPVTSSIGLFDTCKDQVKKTTQQELFNQDTQPLGLFNQYEKKKLFENPNPITNTTTTGTSSSLFSNSGSSLFNVPFEKQDQYKDAKYESVILNDVCFGVPNEKTDDYLMNKAKKNKNKKPKQKTILETSMMYRYSPEKKEEKELSKETSNKPVIELVKCSMDNMQSNKIVDIVSNTVQSNKVTNDKRESVILDNVTFGVPKDKTDEYIKNQSDIKYESVILKNVVFGAPKDNEKKEMPLDQNDNVEKKQELSLFNIKSDEPKTDTQTSTMPSLFGNNNAMEKKESSLFTNNTTMLFPSLIQKDSNNESNLSLFKQNESSLFDNSNYTSSLFNSNKGLFTFDSNSKQPIASSKPLNRNNDKHSSKKKKKGKKVNATALPNNEIDSEPLFSFLNNDKEPQIKFKESLFNLNPNSNDNTKSSNTNIKSESLFGSNTTTSTGLFNQKKDTNTINPFSAFLNKESNSE